MANITALLPSPVEQQIAPHPAPAVVDYPLITYQRTATGPIHDLGGSTAQTAARFYINAWTRDFAGAVALGEEIRKAFDGYSDRSAGVQSIQMTNDFSDYDEDEMVFRRTVEVLIWHDQDT